VIRQANLFEADVEGRVQQLTSGIGAGNGLTGMAWIGDRIVYASSADGNHDLRTIRGSEHDAVRLTDDASFDARPAAAPDGSAIYYLSGAPQRHAVWSVRPDGTERRQVTSGPRDGAFAISPDSKSIAWASLDARTNAWGLWTMPAAGGARRRIATSPSVLDHVVWTPDGKSILFTGYDKATLRVYRVPAAGGAATPLTKVRSHGASISPDGTTIACSYEAIDELHAPVALIDANRGTLKTLDLKGSMYRWHPSGRAISFVSEENGRMDLWLQPLDGTPPRRLTQFSDGSIYDYAWNAAGTRVVIAHALDTADVVLMR
jgi:Tol biopolymer transport system component